MLFVIFYVLGIQIFHLFSNGNCFPEAECVPPNKEYEEMKQQIPTTTTALILSTTTTTTTTTTKIMPDCQPSILLNEWHIMYLMQQVW